MLVNFSDSALAGSRLPIPSLFNLPFEIQASSLEAIELIDKNLSKMHNNPEVFEGTRADSLDPVHRAIRSGDVNLLKNLAAKGRSLRISDNLGYTPIHYACLYGQEECLDELLQHDEVDINEKSHAGDTPLHLLCKNLLHTDVQQKIRLIEKMLAHRPGELEIDAKNNEEIRPIFFACMSCEVDLLRFLAEKCKADLLCTSADGLNLLHVILEEHATTIDHEEETMESKKEKCLNYLLNECQAEDLVHDRDDRDLLPYQVAIISRLEKIALQLISLADDREILEPAGSYRSLSIAAGRGLLSVVKELIRKGAEPNLLDGDEGDEITALQMACISDSENEEVVKLLAKMTEFEVLKECQESIFQVCIDQGSWNCLKILIEEYPDMDDLAIDIDCSNSKYSMVTPLSYLIGWTIHDETILECVKIFIEKGCDLNGTRKAGRIPALIALGRYYKYPKTPNEYTTQIIDQLVKAGAKISHEFRFAEEIARFDMRMLLMYLKKAVVSPEKSLVKYYTARIGTVPPSPSSFQTWVELSGIFLCIMSIGPTNDLFLRWNEVLEFSNKTEDLKAEAVIDEELKKPPSLEILASRMTRKVYIEDSKLSLKRLLADKTIPKVIKDVIKFSQLDSQRLHNLLQDIQDKLDPSRRQHHQQGNL